jgi:L-ascorbate metabolism protein UlaG (beta-lactamase superfamily)
MSATVSKAGWSRRKWIGAAGATGAVGLGAFAAAAYRAAPHYWQRLPGEMRRPVAPAPRTPDVASWTDSGLHLAWLGHATALMRIDGYTILTDPLLGRRAGPDLRLFQIGLKRLVEPALTVDELPPIDLVLVSHAHMDHLDTPTLRALESKRTDIVMARATSDLVRGDRWRTLRELRWREEARVGPATLRAIEVKHWGARVRTDNWRGYAGFTIEIGRWRVLFAGDTGDTHLFGELKSSRPYQVALMPIGAYNPWIRNHCNPEQAWRMINEAGAELVVPVHHLTFNLSREPVAEPMERLRAAAGSSGQERIVIDGIGQELRLT